MLRLDAKVLVTRVIWVNELTAVETEAGIRRWSGPKGRLCVFLETLHPQEDRDAWYHPHDGRGHPLDRVLCRSRDHRFLGAAKVPHEHNVSG